MKNRLTVWFAGLALVVAMSGCGGGGGSSTSTKGTKPTSATRARVLGLFGGSVRSMTQAGFQTAHVASSVNAAASIAPTASATGGTASGNTSVSSGVPMVAAFLRNNENTAASRARHISRRKSGRDVAVAPDPGGAIAPDPGGIVGTTSDFYFDYYLGLWVATTDTDSQSTYLLYIDEAKTQPAGSIVTVWPADYSVYPQTYNSTYTFKAGYLAGSFGLPTPSTMLTAPGSRRTPIPIRTALLTVARRYKRRRATAPGHRGPTMPPTPPGRRIEDRSIATAPAARIPRCRTAISRTMSSTPTAPAARRLPVQIPACR